MFNSISEQYAAADSSVEYAGWNIACSLVGGYQCLGRWCLCHQVGRWSWNFLPKRWEPLKKLHGDTVQNAV